MSYGVDRRLPPALNRLYAYWLMGYLFSGGVSGGILK